MQRSGNNVSGPHRLNQRRDTGEENMVVCRPGPASQDAELFVTMIRHGERVDETPERMQWFKRSAFKHTRLSNLTWSMGPGIARGPLWTMANQYDM